MSEESDLVWSEESSAWIGNGPLTQVQRVLIVVAHPDDLESQAGGAVTLMTRGGTEVHLVLCTSGDKGSSDRSLTSADVASVREAEQREAASYLGIHSVEFLGWPDGEVEPGRTLRESIVNRIRFHRPDVVMTHDPVHPWPVYRAHRDHRNVGQTVLDAIYPDARDHLSFPEQIASGLEPHVTPEAWLFMSSQPDWIIDISDVFNEKVNARLLHRSQTGSAVELRERYADRAATIGRPAGLQFGEALTRVRFA